VCKGTREARQPLHIAVRLILSQLQTGARLLAQRLPVTDGDTVRTFGNEAALLHLFENLADLVFVDPDLRSQKIRRKRKIRQTGPVIVGQQPSCNTLVCRVELAATEMTMCRIRRRLYRERAVLKYGILGQSRAAAGMRTANPPISTMFKQGDASLPCATDAPLQPSAPTNATSSVCVESLTSIKLSAASTGKCR
jgi:hypothetical protein